jgi:hypothetical protein
MDEPWSLAHAITKAVQQFDADTSIAAGAVKSVVFFFTRELATAAVLSTVFRELFSAPPSISQLSDATIPPITDAPSSQPSSDSPPPSTNPWYAIDGIFGHRRHKGKDFYLVK